MAQLGNPVKGLSSGATGPLAPESLYAVSMHFAQSIPVADEPKVAQTVVDAISAAIESRSVLFVEAERNSLTAQFRTSRQDPALTMEIVLALLEKRMKELGLDTEKAAGTQIKVVNTSRALFGWAALGVGALVGYRLLVRPLIRR